MNPLDNIFVYFSNAPTLDGNAMVALWRDICYGYSCGLRPTTDFVSSEFTLYLCNLFWDRVEQCIGLCQSIGDVLSLYNTAPWKFEGLIQVLQDRFHQLWYQRRIDLDRLESAPLFKLFGFQYAYHLMVELESMLPLPFALNTDINFCNGNIMQYQAQLGSEVQTVIPPLNDCQFQHDEGQVNMNICNREMVSPAYEFDGTILPRPPIRERDENGIVEIFHVPAITPPKSSNATRRKH